MITGPWTPNETTVCCTTDPWRSAYSHLCKELESTRARSYCAEDEQQERLLRGPAIVFQIRCPHSHHVKREANSRGMEWNYVMPEAITLWLAANRSHNTMVKWKKTVHALLAHVIQLEWMQWNCWRQARRLISFIRDIQKYIQVLNEFR